MEPASTSQPDHAVWPPPIHEETTVAADRWRLSSTPQGIACEWRPMPLTIWLGLIPWTCFMLYLICDSWLTDVKVWSGHVPNPAVHATLSALPMALIAASGLTFFYWFFSALGNRNVSLFEYQTGYVTISGRWRYRLDESHGFIVKNEPLHKKYSIVFRLLPDRTNPSQQMNWLVFTMLQTRFLPGLKNEKAAFEAASYLSQATGIPIKHKG